MKPFDLQEALNGEPVMLRNGEKAFVKYNLLNEVEKLEVRDAAYPLIGYRFDGTYINTTSWSLTGKSVHWRTIEYDIIGMWEEPKLTSEQVLEKAYEDDLLVLCDGNPDLPLKVIAKAKNGEFVMQPEDDTIQPCLANLTMEWFFVKDPEPKSDTITVTLPKPFKPKQGETYYSITQYSEGVDTMHANRLDHGSILNGNCFRAKSDAQAWLDAMKSALDD
jgi:hypothetical protein